MKYIEGKAIWKFPLKTTEKQTLMMPVGAVVISLQAQGEVGCLWALCKTSAPKEKRTFVFVGTGHELPDCLGKYIGSFQQMDGVLVWHVFEYLEKGTFIN